MSSSSSTRPTPTWTRTPTSARIAEVVAEIQATGTYTHTTDELTVGAKLAWYNHTRCVGKLYWRSLTVRDCRDVTTPEGIRDECFEHQRVVHNGGRIKPTITIFAPDAPGKPAARLRNGQIVAYAGYQHEDGTVLGDGGAPSSPSSRRAAAGTRATRRRSTCSR